jgi:L-serine/L-threonine ammonia-lyase
MIEKIRSRGATDIIQHGASWREADTYLREVILAADPHGVYVPPFDHEDIWEGNSTLVHELWTQMSGSQKPTNGHAAGGLPDAPPKAIICSVGGGGLFCGIMRGLARHPAWSSVSVVAAETLGAESLHRSLRAGELVTLPGITSKATSLGATRVAEGCFAYARGDDRVRSVTVSDHEAARACCFVADEDRMMVELACGASVAVCFDGGLEEALGCPLKPTDSVVVVLCGGSNVSVDLLGLWKNGSQPEPVANANGHTNGHANGFANSHADGHANGHANDHANSHQ